MFKKLNPSLSFLLIAVLLWLLQYGFDIAIGDGDGKIIFWGTYVFVGFMQVFLILSALLWLPEVIRRLKGNFASTSKDFLKRNAGSVFICFILFFVILIDFFGFAFFNEKEVERIYKASHYRTPHPCFHHGLVQNMAVEGVWGDIKYPLYTNSFAFKDSSVFEAKQNLDKKQVVFIGDSFTEGVGVIYQNTFFGRMRQEFSTNNQIELWNAGCVSYSPLVYYNKIKYYTEVENFKIDYLWVFIDGSDIQDEINYKDFEPNCNEKFVPKAGTIEYYRYNKKDDNSLLDIYKNHSLLVRLVSNTYNKFFADPEADEKIKYISNRLSWIDNDAVYQEWGKEGIKLAENHMQKLVELCKEKNIKLTIAVYPWATMINNHKRQLETWERFTQKNNIHFINLFPVFEEKVKETSFEQVNKKYFIQGDGHWNAEGHKLVKEAIKTPFEKIVLGIEEIDSLSTITN
ncbi:hypothetical protein [Bernardetia sp. MNP-M8]|uniref:hypothetical protein n=1 Tax=Bernardetia sp. MNP-M8 TaxID=3127470 RepID=UPI0030CAA334